MSMIRASSGSCGDLPLGNPGVPTRFSWTWGVCMAFGVRVDMKPYGAGAQGKVPECFSKK